MVSVNHFWSSGCESTYGVQQSVCVAFVKNSDTSGAQYHLLTNTSIIAHIHAMLGVLTFMQANNKELSIS